MVPAIFKDMDLAENSDGFDSCEEIEFPVKQKRTGNPFSDFNLDLEQIEDPEVQMIIKLERKMIVNWIESGEEDDMDGWKLSTSGGYHKNSVKAYLGTKSSPNVRSRVHIQLPNCQLDDVLKYVVDRDYKFQLEGDQFSDIQVTRDYGLNTKQMYMQMKTIWPLGSRDMLLNTHWVQFEGQAWGV